MRFLTLLNFRPHAKESPLKRAPLRSPGQSFSDSLDDVVFGDLATVTVALAVLIIAGWEWYRAAAGADFHPELFGILGGCVLLLCAYRFFRGWRRIRNLKLGRSGERVVGQFLETLRHQEDCHVFHDIVAEGFNIDHLIVSPKGVFLIETRTFSKRPGKNDQVHYDGIQLRVDGVRLSGDPLRQVEASARWLRDLVQERAGRQVAVRPVIVFPGWYVNNLCPAPTTWVVNPRLLPGYLQRERERLSPAAVESIASGIADYVRARG